jgi:ABC-2 type transport system permease protein
VPIWQPAPIFGALLGDVFRYSLAATMVITLGVIMGFRPAAGVLGVAAAVALIIVFAISVSWMWIIVGMLVKSPESVMTSSFLLLFPLTMASNIFVDPRTMPGWLQKVVAVNPVSHLANASRGLMHGDVDPANIVWVLVASAATTAVFAPIAMRMYHRER